MILSFDPKERFSDRVDHYRKYRPHYPPAIVDILKKEIGLKVSDILADIGSGTGLLSEIFLQHGNQVLGIEPNEPMRLAAEDYLHEFENFTSITGQAEDTGIESNSIDHIMAGQSFHWFDLEKAKQEFSRIIRPNGSLVLVWNERRVDSSQFLMAYEALLLEYGTDYRETHYERVKLDDVYSKSGYQSQRLDNFQRLDFESLKGRLLSASYAPNEKHENYQPMLNGLREVFDRFQEGGKVTIEYDTWVYWGQ